MAGIALPATAITRSLPADEEEERPTGVVPEPCGKGREEVLAGGGRGMKGREESALSLLP